MVFSLIFDSFYKTATLERYDTFEKLFERVRLVVNEGAPSKAFKKKMYFTKLTEIKLYFVWCIWTVPWEFSGRRETN
jgi:hypothetical protein